MKRIIGKAFNGAVVLLAHGALSFVLIAVFRAIEAFIDFVSGGHPLLLFDAVPLTYLFQALDVAMIVLFGWLGLKEAYEVMK